MAHVPASPNQVGGRRYRRHHPEETLLYQLVEQYYPEFAELMRLQDRSLPTFVQREFEDFLKCGGLEYGFLRVWCNECHTEKLVERISQRVGRQLERRGLIVRDDKYAWLVWDDEQASLLDE